MGLCKDALTILSVLVIRSRAGFRRNNKFGVEVLRIQSQSCGYNKTTYQRQSNRFFLERYY